MDSFRRGDPDEPRRGSDLPPEAASVPASAVDGDPAGIATVHPASVVQELERRSWPEWARAGGSEVRGLQPHRATPATVRFSRPLSGWRISWREWSPSPGGAASLSPAAVVAIAVCTSIVVSLVTTSTFVLLAAMWLPNPTSAASPRNDGMPMVAVAYEPLDPGPAPPAPQPIAQPVLSPPQLPPLAQPEALPPQPPRPIAKSETPAPKPPRSIAQQVVPAPAVEAVKSAAPARRSTNARATAAGVPSDFVVTSEPEGAHVTINGIGYGLTPVSVRFLPSGAKRIRVSMTGYESAERVVGADTRQTSVTLRIAQQALSGQPQSQ